MSELTLQQHAALKVAQNKLLQVHERTKIIQYLAAREVTPIITSLLDLYLRDLICPPTYSVLKLLSAHFLLAIDQTKSIYDSIVWYAKPIREESGWFDGKYIENVFTAVNLIAVAKRHCSVFMKTIATDVRIMWYDPFRMRISVQYMDDGGYNVRDWDWILKRTEV